MWKLYVFHNILLFQNFYKTELNKEEMYIRYIHKLHDLHLKAQNFTGKSFRIYNVLEIRK